jgi:adenylate cyclase|tara:strand:+ start:1168 stop:2916 length:1749 start_codon:yes stop_codon:yes gene_type:complete
MKKTIIFLSLFILLGAIYYFQPAAYEILKLKTFDSLITDKQPSGNFVILNINENDITNEGGYPLSRQTLAQIQINLLRSGAIGVGWVVAFPQPDRFGGDFDFTEALGFSPSVLAMFEGEGDYPPTSGTVILGPESGGIMSEGVIQNIDILKANASQGLAVARTDVDNLVRRLPLLMRTPDGWVSTYGTEVLKVLAGADTYIIKTNDNGLEEVRVKGLPSVPVDSLGRKWVSWVNTPQTNLSEMDVENKFVFVGFTAKGIMPQIATPAGLLEPHKIQAALAESILIQDSPYIPDYALALEILIFSFSVVLVWLVLNVFGITAGISFFFVVFISTAFYGVYTIQNGVLIDVTWALISQFITASVAFYLRFREQYKLRQQIKKQFEHYLDPRQVKALQKDPGLLKLGGEKKRCTFLFTDVRGFTAMSESMEPEQVTQIMNKALTIQSDAVKKYGGMVDKYIGDAMMAIFNAPLDLDNHEQAAVMCAKEIQDNFRSSDVGVEIGVGVNTGEAVIGNCGSSTRFDYTAIGSAVNIAARCESSCKTVGKDLIIAEETAKNCGFELKSLKPIEVKGISKPLKIFTLEDI